MFIVRVFSLVFSSKYSLLFLPSFSILHGVLGWPGIRVRSRTGGRGNHMALSLVNGCTIAVTTDKSTRLTESGYAVVFSNWRVTVFLNSLNLFSHVTDSFHRTLRLLYKLLPVCAIIQISLPITDNQTTVSVVLKGWSGDARRIKPFP